MSITKTREVFQPTKCPLHLLFKRKIGMLILEHTYFNILRVTLTVG